MTETSVAYHSVNEFPGWEGAPALLDDLITRYGPKTVLEIGSGANPTMTVADVNRWNIRYITSDIDDTELAKADAVYTARRLDVSEGEVPEDLLGHCDLIFSRMVNEHVRDGFRYHSNIFKMLSPGGIAAHAFSTLYTLPFLANYLMPVRLGDALYNFFAPRDAHQHAKFPAHYSWGRGPTAASIERFGKIGYQVISYDGYFGHNYYRDRSSLLHGLEQRKTQMLLKAKAPLFCSYAVVVLRKPPLAAG